jgi:copper chaperone CopZ
MKNLTMLLIFVIGVSFVSVAQKTDRKVVCFKSNMDCADCEITIMENLKFEKGVKDLKIDHVSNTILVEYKEGKNTDEQLAKAVINKGYKAEKITMEQYKEMVEYSANEAHQHEAEEHKERKE